MNEIRLIKRLCVRACMHVCPLVALVILCHGIHALDMGALR